MHNDEEKEVPAYVNYFFHECEMVRLERVIRRLMRLNILKDILITVIISRFVKYLCDLDLIAEKFASEIVIAFAVLAVAEFAVHIKNER